MNWSVSTKNLIGLPPTSNLTMGSRGLKGMELWPHQSPSSTKIGTGSDLCSFCFLLGHSFFQCPSSLQKAHWSFLKGALASLDLCLAQPLRSLFCSLKVTAIILAIFFCLDSSRAISIIVGQFSHHYQFRKKFSLAPSNLCNLCLILGTNWDTNATLIVCHNNCINCMAIFWGFWVDGRMHAACFKEALKKSCRGLVQLLDGLIFFR